MSQTSASLGEKLIAHSKDKFRYLLHIMSWILLYYFFAHVLMRENHPSLCKTTCAVEK